jgi:hypothetical protein
VVVGLRDGRTVPAESSHAVLIRGLNVDQNARGFRLHPQKQRRPKVKADLRVVIHEANDPLRIVKQARLRIRRVALGRDAFVPVMVRLC